MFDLFEGDRDPSIPLYKFPAWLFIKRNMLLELKRVYDYFHTNVRPLAGAHILKNLINSLNVPVEYSIDKYVELASQRAMNYAKMAQFSTPYNDGKIFHGVFYGEGSNEIIMLTDEYINVFDEYKNWRDLESIRVLLHPISDLALIPPDGIKQSTANGLCVIEINIAKLAMQYHGFCASEKIKLIENKEGIRLGLEHFLKMYVLPNMLPSHLDMVIYNRMKNLFYGEPMSTPLRRLPFTIRDYETRIDRVLGSILDILGKKKLLYSNALYMMPAITEADMYDVMKMPDNPLTRQINWVYAVGRVSVYRFLVEVCGGASVGMNLNDIVIVKRNLRYLKYESILAIKLSPDDLYDITDDIKFIEHLI